MVSYFDAFVKVYYSTKSVIDHFLDTNKDTNGNLLTLINYYDDMLIACKYCTQINALRKYLRQPFELKDLSYENHILGMQTTTEQRYHEIYLDQRECIGDLLQRIYSQGIKNIGTFLRSYVKLSEHDGLKLDVERIQMAKTLYNFACGCLMSAMAATCLDIALYMSSLEKQNYEVVKGLMSI